MQRDWQVSLKISDATDAAKVVRCVRKAVTVSMAEISSALKHYQPIPICTLFTNDHEEDEKALLGLIQELERLAVTIEISISGQVESKQYLHNILQRHREIAYDTQMETDLELGEETEESRAWAAGRVRYPKSDA